MTARRDSSTSLQDTAPDDTSEQPSGADQSAETSFEASSADPSSAPDPAGTARAVAERANRRARHLIDESKDSTERVADRQKDLAAEFLHDVANAFHKSADALKENGRGNTASLVDWTADEVETLAEGLAHRTPGEMIGEIEDFARREPALAAGAAFLVGFGILRFLKSTAAASDTPDRGRVLGS